ncbi:GDP-mannose 4,6-dehydratase [Streptomyces atratus]|uniref:GDP-mannose 4,6-dehydratase n=1 Tax=Streptomyces atratus TaxID=1893 RepID=UPI00340744C3
MSPAPGRRWRPRCAPAFRRFAHVSTDEVYGSIEQGAWTEDRPLRPHSPYAGPTTRDKGIVSMKVRRARWPVSP